MGSYEVFKEVQKIKKLTQKQLAELIGFTKSHYVKVELGVRKPGLKFIKSLKENFEDLAVNEFFNKKKTVCSRYYRFYQII